MENLAEAVSSMHPHSHSSTCLNTKVMDQKWQQRGGLRLGVCLDTGMGYQGHRKGLTAMPHPGSSCLALCLVNIFPAPTLPLLQIQKYLLCSVIATWARLGNRGCGNPGREECCLHSLRLRATGQVFRYKSS